MTIVGLPDTAVQESRERVQTAVKNAGLHFPRHRIVVNLAPATVRKEGPSYDLPIALGVIVLTGFLPHDKVENTMVIGELSLDGVVRHARGVLPMAATARANGFKRMFVPEVDAPEAALMPDLEIFPVKTLADLFDHLAGRRLIEPYLPSADSLEPLFTHSSYAVCISTARFISLVKTFLSKSDINVAVQKPIPSALRKVSYSNRFFRSKGTGTRQARTRSRCGWRT